MAITDSLNAARAKLEETMKDRRFRRANLDREEKIALQAAQAKCRGKLEVCQRDFDRIIKEQCRYIREGESIGADTLIQQQMLWDAAIGYMLVKDAIYSLKTINTHNSLSHAYDMLDLATRHMSGKKSGLPLKAVRDRNIYGFVTSSAAYKQKSALLDGFFEELKLTGKIEDCLEGARHPSKRDNELRDSYANGAPLPSREPAPAADEDDPMSRIRSRYGTTPQQIDFTDDDNPMLDGVKYGNTR